MKKLLYLLLIITGFCNAQIVNIPDANFKAKLLAASPSNQIAKNLSGNFFKIDSNNDAEIQVSEAEQVSYLDVSASSINSLIGIMDFLNLQTLACYNNQITSIEILNNSNFLNLNCNSNLLSSLNVQGCINLYTLACRNNQLSNINISGFNYLYYFECRYNQLTSLNVSGCSNLSTLFCQNNQITILNLSGCSNLNELNCVYNQIVSLDFSNCDDLTFFSFYYNPLLKFLNIKNGNSQGNSNLNLGNILSLRYICSDDSEVTTVQNSVSSNCQVNTYCSFTPGGVYYTMQGNNRFDYNINSCDNNDIIYPNLKYSVTNDTYTGVFISNTSGNYSIPVGTGSFTLTPILNNPTYYNVSPSTIQVTFPATASPFNQNFCITPNGIHHDVEVTLIPITPARPGFDATYKIIYKNKGTQVENGAVTLTYLNQDALDIVSCNPAFNSENSDGFEKTLTWNYVNLQPFQTREITVVLNLNGPMETPALNIGETLSMTSTVTPEINDENPIDNSSSIRQVIVGSYDPNDKTCIEGATITPAMVGEYVHYVIRFENTGTYPAQNVVVKDMIDLEKFDITTLLPIKGSHNFETRIAGNKVEFIFENINLPFDDANNDGYVAFKIKTKPNLVLGNTFSNQANIYFDYNFPIITNNYTTTVQNTLGLQDNEIANVVLVHPNPVKDILYFNSKETIFKIEIYDIAGRIISSNSVSGNKLDVSNLKSGTYFVKLFSENGALSKKIIKE